MQIQISWLLQKPTDLDLHCLQSQGISGFSRTRVNGIYKTTIGLDKSWHQVNCFLISRRKHMLWVLIRSTSPQHMFLSRNKKNIATFLLKKKKKRLIKSYGSLSQQRKYKANYSENMQFFSYIFFLIFFFLQKWRNDVKYQYSIMDH